MSIVNIHAFIICNRQYMDMVNHLNNKNIFSEK